MPEAAAALVAPAAHVWPAFRIMLRDARKHRSPNAGWPEAAMAGALGIRLGGPATYGGAPIVRAHFGSGAVPQVRDLRRALHLGRAVAAALIVTALVTSHARRSRR